MNWLKKITLAMLLLPAMAPAEDWYDAVKGWNEAVSRSIAGTGTAQEVEAAGRTLQEWHRRQAPGFQWENEQQRASLDLVDFKISQAWARAGDYRKALQHLGQEAAAKHAAGGRLLESTRNPSAFTSEVFALHSAIMAHTGDIMPIRDAGYKVFAAPSHDGAHAYVFVYEPSGTDEGGVAVEGLAEDEQRQMIELYVRSADGRYHMADFAQVIGKRDQVTVSSRSRPDGIVLALDGITKIVEYRGELGVPRVRAASSKAFEMAVSHTKLEQPMTALSKGAALQPGTDDNASAVVRQPSAAGAGAAQALPAETTTTPTVRIFALVIGSLFVAFLWWWWRRKH